MLRTLLFMALLAAYVMSETHALAQYYDKDADNLEKVEKYLTASEIQKVKSLRANPSGRRLPGSEGRHCRPSLAVTPERALSLDATGDSDPDGPCAKQGKYPAKNYLGTFCSQDRNTFCHTVCGRYTTKDSHAVIELAEYQQHDPKCAEQVDDFTRKTRIGLHTYAVMTDDEGNARKDEDGHDIEVYLWSQEEAITINTAQDAEGTATMSATDGVFEAKTKVEYTIQVDVVNGDETITSGNSATVTYALDSTKYESDLDSVILLGSNGRKIVLLKDGTKTDIGEVIIIEMGNGVVKFSVPSFGTIGTPTVITVRIKTRLSLKRRSLLEYVFGGRSLVGDTSMGSGGAPLTITNDGKGTPAPCDGYIEDCEDLVSADQNDSDDDADSSVPATVAAPIDSDDDADGGVPAKVAAHIDSDDAANGGAPVMVGGLAIFAAVVSGAASL